jgi:hypothetical protein
MEQKYPIQKEVFKIACSHFPKVIDTLTGIDKLNQLTLGLEGWFRVELAKALENTDLLMGIRNKGADLNLKGNENLELKAGADLNFHYILKGMEGQPCLFLGKPRGKLYNSNLEMIENEFEKRIKVYKEIFRLKNNWYLGLIYQI